MSSFDSHSLTLQKIILVFKRLHAPLNSVIGKRGWKYNVLQAKLHFSDYSLKRANTPRHVFITSSQFSVITRYQALGRILLCFAWKDAAFVEYVRGAVLLGLFHTSFQDFYDRSQTAAEQGNAKAFLVHGGEISTWGCPQFKRITRNGYCKNNCILSYVAANFGKITWNKA